MNEMARTPEVLAYEINTIKDQTRMLVLSNSILIGKKLKEAQQMMEHGQFGKWLQEAVSFSVSTANNLMRVYDEYGADQGVLFGSAAKSSVLENLSYTQAVLLLGVPREEREEFIQKEHVDEISTRELKEKVAELKKAKEAAESETDNVRKVLAAEIDKKAKAEESLRAQRQELEMSKNKLLSRDEQIATRERRIRELEEQIKDMEAPVTVETTAKEVVEVVPEEVKQELEALRKQLAAQQDALQNEKTKFKFQAKFQSVQEAINGLLADIDGSADKELQGGMYKACEAMLKRTLEVITEREK